MIETGERNRQREGKTERDKERKRERLRERERRVIVTGYFSTGPFSFVRASFKTGLDVCLATLQF